MRCGLTDSNRNLLYRAGLPWQESFLLDCYPRAFGLNGVYTRGVVGIAISLRKGVPITLQVLYGALFAHPRPLIFHSDKGREYGARVFTKTLSSAGIRVSRSAAGSPWQNGYQESFYDKFKVELADPNR